MDKRSIPSKPSRPSAGTSKSSKSVAGKSTRSKKSSKPNTKARPKNILVPKPTKTSGKPIIMGDLSARHPDSSVALLMASTENTTSDRELLMEAVAFFDIALEESQQAQTVLFCLEQGFYPTGSQGGPIARPSSCEVFVLPKSVNAANAESTFVASTFLQGVANDTADQYRSKAPSINVQMTTVAPDFDIKWRRVGYFNYDKIFDNSNLRPWTYTKSSAEEEFKPYQQLFCISCFDSDTGDSVTSGIQVKYKVKFRQVMPVKPFITIATAKVIKFDVLPGVVVPDIEQFAQLSIKGISDST